jgi:hypothetical protein
MKGKVKNPLSKLVLGIKRAKAKLKCQKTELSEKIDLGNGKELVLDGCDVYTDLTNGFSELEDCNIRIQEKEKQDEEKRGSHTISTNL